MYCVVCMHACGSFVPTSLSLQTELDRLEFKNAKLRSQVKDLCLNVKGLTTDVTEMKAMVRSIMLHHNLKPAKED